MNSAHHQHPDEHQKYQPDRKQVRHPPTLHGTHQPLHQERQHQSGQHRRQHLAKCQDDRECKEQQNRENNRLLVGEVTLHPTA